MVCLSRQWFKRFNYVESEQPPLLGYAAYLLYFCAFLLGMAIPISTALQNISIGLVVCLVFLLSPLRQRLRRVVCMPISQVGIFVFCLLLLGCAWSSVPIMDRVNTLLKMRWLVLFPFLLAFFANAKISLFTLLGFVSGVVVSILLSIGLAATGTQWLMSMVGDWTVFRTHAYHNYFIALLVYGVLVWLTVKKPAPWIKWAAIATILLSLFDAFVLVQGRSGNVVMLALIGLWGIQRFHWKRIMMLAVVAILCIPFVPTVIKHIPALHHSIERGSDDLAAYRQGQTETSLGLRLEFYKNSLNIIAMKPWLGQGTGAFTDAYRQSTGFSTGVRASSNPHNDYLKFTVELGLLGLCAIVALILVGWWQAQAYAPLQRQLARGLIFSMALASVANSFFTDNITSAAFVVLLSMLFAHIDCASKRDFQ